MVTDVSDDKLTVDVAIDVGALAHHAGYRRRIHWDQAHCARDVRTASPIGHDIARYLNGQGVCELFILQ